MTADMIGSTRSHGKLRFRPKLVSCVLGGVLLLSSQGWAAAAQLTLPDAARAMTGVELYMLYRDKSWKWNDGAGRMEDEGRRFKAWAGSGDSAVWATGRWIVTDTGRLCLKADWHTPTGLHPDKTCFSHRISGQTIYQKREPTGDWYVFRHSVPEDSDEFRKLVKEDLVSPQFELFEASPRKAKATTEKASLVQQISSDAREMEN